MTGIVEGQIVRNTPQFSNAVSLVVEAIGKCMVGSSLEEQAIAALEASHHAALVEALRTLATFDFGTRADMRKYAAKALAKIGGAA